MHPIKTHIFLTGATGYIGGSVLTRLLSHPLSDTFQTTVLVRSPAKATQFRMMGVKAIVGSLADLALLEKLAGDADVVFACADADDLPAAKAILRGLKTRFERSKNISSLIHTSGTGVLADDARGMHSTDTIYSDLDIAQLESLPRTAPHRDVDLTLVEADNQGYVKTHIILPSTIYGVASGPLVDLDLQNPHSQEIPTLVDLGLERGQGGMVGEGRNMWPNVHINEVADLYIILFDLIISPHTHKHPAHGRAGFYFAENGEHTLYSVSEAVARVLYDLGKAKDPRPTAFTEDEMGKYFPNGTILGANSRCRADRSRAVGWKPKKGTKDLLASVRGEVGV